MHALLDGQGFSAVMEQSEAQEPGMAKTEQRRVSEIKYDAQNSVYLVDCPVLAGSRTGQRVWVC